MSSKTVYLIVLMVSSSLSPCIRKNQTGTLVMVHVLFRHGDRTAVTELCYPTDPYKNEKYLPFGPGELTNIGKQREYNLGRMLRQRYNQLLGELYTPNLIYARSSGSRRCQMSLLLVLAALFPLKGEEIWNNSVPWQPIPYESMPLKSDKLLRSFSSCPNFPAEFHKVLKSEPIQQVNRNYTELFNYISQHSGYNTTDVFLASLIYITLKAEAEYGLKLPKWTSKLYPDVLKEVADKGYSLFAATNLKPFLAGFLLQKIVNDTKARIEGQTDPKLFLYSAHDINVAAMLATLSVLRPHVPPYGSCILIEVHHINDRYWVKIFYENYEGVQTGLLTIPGCDKLCPLDKFISTVEKYFPDDNVCGLK